MIFKVILRWQLVYNAVPIAIVALYKIDKIESSGHHSIKLVRAIHDNLWQLDWEIKQRFKGIVIWCFCWFFSWSSESFQDFVWLSLFGIVFVQLLLNLAPGEQTLASNRTNHVAYSSIIAGQGAASQLWVQFLPLLWNFYVLRRLQKPKFSREAFGCVKIYSLATHGGRINAPRALFRDHTSFGMQCDPRGMWYCNSSKRKCQPQIWDGEERNKGSRKERRDGRRQRERETVKKDLYTHRYT